MAELRALRQRKDELESHLGALQDSRRQLMVQLEGLMKLLKVCLTDYCQPFTLHKMSFKFLYFENSVILDVMLCHWVSSSSHFEGTMVLSDIGTYNLKNSAISQKI